MSYSKLSFYEDFHFKLGKIVVSYNLIEHIIIGLICNLIDHNDITVGFRKCKRKGATQLLSLLKSEMLTKIKDEKILNQFSVLHEHLKEVIQIRNGYIHSIYIYQENEEMRLIPEIINVSQIKIRELEKGSTSILSGLIYKLDGMDNFIKILNDVYDEANQFFNDISEVIPVRQIKFSFPERPKNLK